MKLLLRTWSSVEDYSANISAAFIDVSKETAQRILKRAKSFKLVQASDDDIVEMCFWENGKGPSFLTDATMVLRGLTDEELNKLNDDGFLDLDKLGKTIDPEKDAANDIELIRMLISDDYVIWEADVKYANITISTEGFSLAEIEKML